MASMPLKPYAHQTTAVYGAMLPQPLLRFLLADEPGTGKTIMAGLYLREMQRLGSFKRALIVCPANLASKWVEDFSRLLGGGLRRITPATVREDALTHATICGSCRSNWPRSILPFRTRCDPTKPVGTWWCLTRRTG